MIGCSDPTSPMDCLGVEGGSAEVDECGVCGGNGSSCTVTALSGIVISDPSAQNLNFSFDGGDSDGVIGDEPNSLWLEESSSGVWNVRFNSNSPISGFQFTVEGASISTSDNNAYGGLSESANFSISADPANNIVLGFDFNGTSIEAETGILVIFEIEN